MGVEGEAVRTVGPDPMKGVPAFAPGIDMDEKVAKMPHVVEKAMADFAPDPVGLPRLDAVVHGQSDFSDQVPSEPSGPDLSHRLHAGNGPGFARDPVEYVGVDSVEKADQEGVPSRQCAPDKEDPQKQPCQGVEPVEPQPGSRDSRKDRKGQSGVGQGMEAAGRKGRVVR